MLDDCHTKFKKQQASLRYRSVSCLLSHIVQRNVSLSLFQVPLAKDIYGLIVPNFGVGFAIGRSAESSTALNVHPPVSV